MRARRPRLAWAVFTFLSLGGCGSCIRYTDCRLRRSYESCQRGPDCMPFARCTPDKGSGRCSSACVPDRGECRLPTSAPTDQCLLDARPGQEATCLGIGSRTPNRCQLGEDSKGRVTCLDSDPPCASCKTTFDVCIARNHCTGTFCF